MTMHTLTPDELLETTRSVRKRLDLTRPVEREVLEECLALAQQAPTGSNIQGWHFLVVTDAAKRAALGDLYRKSWYPYNARRTAAQTTERQATQARVVSSAQYLADHMQEVPVLVIPCIAGRTEGKSSVEQAGVWGSSCPPSGASCSPPAPVVSAPAGRPCTSHTSARQQTFSVFPMLR